MGDMDNKQLHVRSDPAREWVKNVPFPELLNDPLQVGVGTSMPSCLLKQLCHFIFLPQCLHILTPIQEHSEKKHDVGRKGPLDIKPDYKDMVTDQCGNDSETEWSRTGKEIQKQTQG